MCESSVVVNCVLIIIFIMVVFMFSVFFRCKGSIGNCRLMVRKVMKMVSVSGVSVCGMDVLVLVMVIGGMERGGFVCFLFMGNFEENGEGWI